MNETKPLQEIGKTSATDRAPNTSEKFLFWLAPDVIVNPFDIVQVDQVSHEGKSQTFGLVTTLEHSTDAPTHLANFISSDFGELVDETCSASSRWPFSIPRAFTLKGKCTEQ